MGSSRSFLACMVSSESADNTTKPPPAKPIAICEPSGWYAAERPRAPKSRTMIILRDARSQIRTVQSSPTVHTWCSLGCVASPQIVPYPWPCNSNVCEYEVVSIS